MVSKRWVTCWVALASAVACFASVGCEGTADADYAPDVATSDEELNVAQVAWSSGAFTGDLSVRAGWWGSADLDLYVLTPSNQTIYYGAREGSRGGLFTKNACGSCGSGASEEVSWVQAAPAGEYRFWLQRYDSRPIQDLQVQVWRSGAIEETFTIGAFGTSAGDRSEMFTFTVGFEPDSEPDEPPAPDPDPKPTPDPEPEPEPKPEPEPQPADPDDQFIGMACTARGSAGTCERVSECGAPSESIAGFCPGSSAVRCCVPGEEEEPVDPVEPGGVCDPDAAPTPNQSWLEAPGVGACQAGMVEVAGSFCVDKYEATLVEVTASGERPWSPFRNPGSASVRAVSVANAVPQGYINADQAERACNASGKRLCTSQEWLSACRGAEQRTFPYGNVASSGTCNEGYPGHPAVDYFGTSADWIWSELGNACINQQPGSVASTGSHPMCATPEGVVDMVGNLHEWVSDSSGTFRGGFYADTSRNGTGCSYRTTAHNRQHWDYSTGFRCCSEKL